jgi:hypothetical protein
MTRPSQSPITDERIDRLARQVLAERAEDVAASTVPAVAMAERIASSLRPSRSGHTRVLLAAALLAALLIGGALAVGGQLRLPRTAPLQGVEWTGPLRSDAQTVPSSAPMQRVEWTGPLRSDAQTVPSSARPGQDGRDAAVEWVDIVAARSVGFRRWELELAGNPPKASTLDPTQQVIEYGVVVDAGGDGIADCLIGINNDAPKRGDYRVWVTNLTTGVTVEQVGAPYGHPIDFDHPDVRDLSKLPSLLGRLMNPPREMRFFFLTGSGPCVLGAGDQRFYAWASLTESGQVTAWDYAPDDGWLP